MGNSKNDMTKVSVSLHNGDARRGAAREDPSYIEKQTRTRRLFSTAQIFCFSLMYFTTWSGMGGNMYYAMLNGGPAAYLFNLIIAVFGALCQAMSFGELASVLPLAGAQYYWTYHWAPSNAKMFLSWLSGWATWLGYIAGLAGVVNGIAITIEGTTVINFPDYEPGGWHTTIIMVAALVFITVINIWGFRIVPWFEFVAGIINVAFFFITMTVLWVMSPRNDASFILSKSHFSNWESDFVIWNVGLLTQVWMFTGFESSIHMGEETQNAKRAAPVAMVYSLGFSGLLGIFATITYIICMPPVEDVINAPYPFYYLILTSTGSKTITTVLACSFVIGSLGCVMSTFSSVTRMTWAWARDGGLPAYFGHVHGKRRVPARAVVLTCFITFVLGLFNLNASTFVALGAITSLNTFSLFFSYAVILSVLLYVRFTTGLEQSEFSLGRWGMPVNILAFMYTIWVMIWLPWPTDIPVTAQTMNYCFPIFAGVMIGAIGAWYVWAKKHWLGPNLAIVAHVLQRDEKE